MRAFILPTVAVALIFCFFPQKTYADPAVSFSVFYDSLTPYGEWINVPPYGDCWQPCVDHDDWSPYSDGYWAYTDCGWTWVSDEPWGWATYHYGRWMLVENRGWVWVPGNEWGPAWVSWRYSDDYVGWAPLPPEAEWHPDSGFDVWVDVRFNIGPSYYNFCDIQNFGSPQLRSHLVRREQNVTIVNKTVNVTKVVHQDVGVFNSGPDLTAVNRRSSTPIERMKLERSQVASGDQKVKRQANRLEMFAPTIRPAQETEHPHQADDRIGKTKNSADRDEVNADRTWQNRLDSRNENRSIAPKSPTTVIQPQHDSIRERGRTGVVTKEPTQEKNVTTIASKERPAVEKQTVSNVQTSQSVETPVQPAPARPSVRGEARLPDRSEKAAPNESRPTESRGSVQENRTVEKKAATSISSEPSVDGKRTAVSIRSSQSVETSAQPAAERPSGRSQQPSIVSHSQKVVSGESRPTESRGSVGSVQGSKTVKTPKSISASPRPSDVSKREAPSIQRQGSVNSGKTVAPASPAVKSAAPNGGDKSSSGGGAQAGGQGAGVK